MILDTHGNVIHFTLVLVLMTKQRKMKLKDVWTRLMRKSRGRSLNSPAGQTDRGKN